MCWEWICVCKAMNDEDCPAYKLNGDQPKPPIYTIARTETTALWYDRCEMKFDFVSDDCTCDYVPCFARNVNFGDLPEELLYNRCLVTGVNVNEVETWQGWRINVHDHENPRNMFKVWYPAERDDLMMKAMPCCALCRDRLVWPPQDPAVIGPIFY